ncbi:hypothetical protein [Micromonospora sp. RP3T]|uniref:hypothetical protein n=1 Tax=Micromonospora sp. RP3T TaxID=2135446 RepID=UPI003D723E7B
MKVDIRWIILVVGVVVAALWVRDKEEWATPVSVGAAVGAVLLVALWRDRTRD